MKESNALIKVEKTLSILEVLAKKYNEGTPEYDAIKLASEALLFINMRDVADQFVEFTITAGKELSPMEKEHLKSLGIPIEQKNSSS